jgi:hypothetical protein
MQVSTALAGGGWDNPAPAVDPQANGQPQSQPEAEPQPQASPAAAHAAHGPVTSLGTLVQPGEPLPAHDGPWQVFEIGTPLQLDPARLGHLRQLPLLLTPDLAIQLRSQALQEPLHERIQADPRHQGGAQHHLEGEGSPNSGSHDEPIGIKPTLALTAPEPVDPADPVAAAQASATPSADPLEIAALELMLAEPGARELIAHFGGERAPLPTWTSVGQGIEARYGADLGARLYQYQQAQRAAGNAFFQAMDQARQHPPALPPAPRHGQPLHTTEQAGWVYKPGGGHANDWKESGWQFDPGVFARHYAAGQSPAQRAFADLHGSEPLQFVRAPDTEAAGPSHWQLAGLAVREGRPVDHDEGLTPDALHVDQDGWVQAGVWRPGHHLDPDRITKLHDPELLWFDPVHGFVTEPGNLKGSWLDRAFPQLMGVAFGVMGAGMAGKLLASAGSVAQGAAAGAAASALNQYVSTGHVSFKSVLSSALAGGLTAGITQLPGLGQHLDGAAASFGQRLVEYTGRATLQGAIQAVVGGQFKDGFVNSLLGSVASEVGGLLNAEIAQLSQRGAVSDSQASTLRLLARATGSALRIVGSEDPAAGFAGDFLSGVLGEALADEVDGAAQAATDPLGDFIAANEQEWANRQANYDQIVAAFSDAPPIDRSDDVLVAGSFNGATLARFAGRGAALIASEMHANGYKQIGSEVYFQPDAPGSKPIRIDGVYIQDGRIVFGEAKIGNYADLSRNQKSGLPALQQGAGYFYGVSSTAVAGELGIKPSSNGRFRIPANSIQGVYVATYERAKSPTNRMNILNDAFRRNGGFNRGLE